MALPLKSFCDDKIHDMAAKVWSSEIKLNDNQPRSRHGKFLVSKTDDGSGDIFSCILWLMVATSANFISGVVWYQHGHASCKPMNLNGSEKDFPHHNKTQYELPIPRLSFSKRWRKITSGLVRGTTAQRNLGIRRNFNNFAGMVARSLGLMPITTIISSIESSVQFRGSHVLRVLYRK